MGNKSEATWHPGDGPVKPLELDAVREQVANALKDDIYACTRVWEAWQYSTMTEDDFTPAWENEDVLDNLMAVVTAALAAETARTDRLVEALRNTEHTAACDAWADMNGSGCTCGKSAAPTTEQEAK